MTVFIPFFKGIKNIKKKKTYLFDSTLKKVAKHVDENTWIKKIMRKHKGIYWTRLFHHSSFGKKKVQLYLQYNFKDFLK